MKIIIELDTTLPVSSLDREVLQALMGGPTEWSTPVVERAKKAAAPKPVAVKKEADAEAAHEADMEEARVKPAAPAPAAPAPASEDSMKEAVRLATALVSSGSSSEVKSVLAGLGAKRVSELQGDQIDAFIAELSS